MTKKQQDFINKIVPNITYIFNSTKKVLPSVVIAQAILESGWGTSELSKVNNIFGLNNYHDGYTVNAEDYPLSVPQEHNGKITYSVENMCKFNSLLDCILTLEKWYTRPKYKDITANVNYKYQCNFLQGRYATDSHYANKLISIIEKYDLTKYDLYKTRVVQFGAYRNKQLAIDYKNALELKLKITLDLIDDMDYTRIVYKESNVDEIKKLATNYGIACFIKEMEVSKL